MKIGEIVETLIWLRDRHSLTQTEDDAVCAACNILDRLPRIMDENHAKQAIQSLRPTITITVSEEKEEHENGKGTV